MSGRDSVYCESTVYAFWKTLSISFFRPTALGTMGSIFYNFFLCQFKRALLPGRVPVTNVDHPLDEKIPFIPSWVTIYIDFTQFWIRILSFFIRRYGRRAYVPIRDFIASMGNLYAYAAEIYKKNLSTTKRPFYIKRFRFLVIHLLDPHLMCIPSLHVMVVILTYTKFEEIAKHLGDGEKLSSQIQEMKQGALAISQAIFFVKQHSINCIPAALYAMTVYSPDLFPQKEAEKFISLLFSPASSKENIPGGCRFHPAAAPLTRINASDQVQIKDHILKLYRQFLEEGKTAKIWYEPILKFLQNYNKDE